MFRVAQAFKLTTVCCGNSLPLAVGKRAKGALQQQRETDVLNYCKHLSSDENSNFTIHDGRELRIPVKQPPICWKFEQFSSRQAFSADRLSFWNIPSVWQSCGKVDAPMRFCLQEQRRLETASKHYREVFHFFQPKISVTPACNALIRSYIVDGPSQNFSSRKFSLRWSFNAHNHWRTRRAVCGGWFSASAERKSRRPFFALSFEKSTAFSTFR